MRCGRSDLNVVNRIVGSILHLSPVNGGNSRTVSERIEGSVSCLGLVIPLITGCAKLTVNVDRGLAGISCSRVSVENLEQALATMIVNAITLLIQNEAVINYTTFASCRCYRRGFLSSTSHGFP